MPEEQTYVSMGLNPHTQYTCGFPRCCHLKVGGDKAFGWCRHPANAATYGTPSVAFSGGCKHHSQYSLDAEETANDDEPIYDIEKAIHIAKLWKAGKLIDTDGGWSSGCFA